MSLTESLKEFYDGEVLGEALYSAMAARAADDRQRRIWGALLQLETETKAWLRAPMTAAGMSLAEDPEARRRGEGYADGIGGLDWAGQMKTLHDVVDGQVIPRFKSLAEAAEAAGDTEEARVCRHMVRHEEVQVELACRELAGEALERVLEPLASELRYPLP